MTNTRSSAECAAASGHLLQRSRLFWTTVDGKCADGHVPRADLPRLLKVGRYTLTITAVGLICLCDHNITRADESLKFRIFLHATSIQTQDMGDVDGHVMAVGRYSGLASFADGSVGTANLTFTSDYIKGAGTFASYLNVAVTDGATLWWKGTGQAKPDGPTTIFPEFPIVVIRGTGRFADANGDGKQNGARVTPLSAGADLYADVVLNVKK